MQYSGTSETLWEVCFIGPYQGWVRGQDSSLFHTSNSGNTWIKQYTFPNIIKSICFPDTDNGWAAGDRIMHTTDGGYSWEIQNTGGYTGFSDVFFIDDSNGWAVGGNGPMLITTDGGTNWEEHNINLDSEINAVHFTDALNGWAVGGTSSLNCFILHTSNGGNSWNQQLYGGTISLSKVFFSDPLNGWASCTYGGPIYYTTDGGDTWETNWTGMSVVRNMYFINSSLGWTVGQSLWPGIGEICKTLDGGLNWESQSTTLAPSHDLKSVSFPDPNNGWAFGDANWVPTVILHTTDGGQNWEVQDGFIGTSYSINFVDEYNGWLLGRSDDSGSVILHSTDAGTTWVEQFSAFSPWLYSMYFLDAINGWAVGKDATIMRTTDGGNNWQQQSGNTNIYYSDVFFTDTDNGWAIGRNTSNNDAIIIHSSDGGVTWEEQFNQTGYMFQGISFSDPENGWIVDYDKIFHTNDGGVNWVIQYSDTTKSFYNVFFTDFDYGWVVGWPGVILYTTNGGEEWMEQASGTNFGLHNIVFTDPDCGWVVDETRPRNQGAKLTAWELKNEGVPHVIIPDNAGAHYMSKGQIDMMIVGADRVAANGDVANKIGTLEKAVVAAKYGIPFYVAAPLSTFDMDCKRGEDIVIEQRDEKEVLFQEGPNISGKITRVWVCNPGSDTLNPAFDVTPADLITGIITEKGIIKPNARNIKLLFE